MNIQGADLEVKGNKRMMMGSVDDFFDAGGQNFGPGRELRSKNLF
jgi:hypothetical protein